MALQIMAQQGGPITRGSPVNRPCPVPHMQIVRPSALPCPPQHALPAFRSSRQPRSLQCQAQAGAGGGSLGGSGRDGWSGGGGGGGGGSGGEGAGDSSSDQPKGGGAFALWRGWQDRVAYDPEFGFKVMLEQVIGVSASVIGDMSSRPNWGLNELDFVFATLVVGSILNFSLMYLLAPIGAGAAAGGSLLGRALGPEFLQRWGAPGGNMFEPGFPLHKRLVNFGYKGVVFAGIGLLAGIVGTSVSNGLLVLRKQLDPSFETQNVPPSVLGNAVCWSAHMGVSSNLRYQLLGGADAFLVTAMPMPLFRAYSAVIRGLNNIVGGMSFVTIARLFGVQKSSSSSSSVAADGAVPA